MTITESVLKKVLMLLISDDRRDFVVKIAASNKAPKTLPSSEAQVRCGCSR
jgi:hypothetical protein